MGCMVAGSGGGPASAGAATGAAVAAALLRTQMELVGAETRAARQPKGPQGRRPRHPQTRRDRVDPADERLPRKRGRNHPEPPDRLLLSQSPALPAPLPRPRSPRGGAPVSPPGGAATSHGSPDAPLRAAAGTVRRTSETCPRVYGQRWPRRRPESAAGPRSAAGADRRPLAQALFSWRRASRNLRHGLVKASGPVCSRDRARRVNAWACRGQ